MRHEKTSGAMNTDPLTEPVEVTVAIASQYLIHFDQVVADCEAVALRVGEKLAVLGIVTGQIEAQKMDRLKQVEGVAAVEESRPYQLPPPENEVQ
jgi:hypothetical protein